MKTLENLARTLRQRGSYADYLQLDDQQRYEVLAGELIMVPSPGITHQTVSKNLQYLFYSLLDRQDKGFVFSAPLDVVFDPHTVCQPDLLVILPENRGVIGTRAITGAPDLVVEIVSPSSTYTDTQQKASIYQRFSVREYWLVFPEQEAVDILNLVQGEYRLTAHAHHAGTVRSPLLEAEFSLEDIFTSVP